MKHDVAIKWVEALRSGKYTQTDGQLASDDGHCCLGVLCEVLAVPYKRTMGNLPHSAMVAAGMNDEDGSPFDGGSVLGESCLAIANDKGRTFPQIADWIEQNWEKL